MNNQRHIDSAGMGVVVIMTPKLRVLRRVTVVRWRQPEFSRLSVVSPDVQHCLFTKQTTAAISMSNEEECQHPSRAQHRSPKLSTTEHTRKVHYQRARYLAQ
jgi:hypothetical protein